MTLNAVKRIFFAGVAAMMVLAPSAAFAEKITLACSLGADYVVLYFTFDLAAKTVKDYDGGKFVIQITDDEINWTGNYEVSPIQSSNRADDVI